MNFSYVPLHFLVYHLDARVNRHPQGQQIRRDQMKLPPSSQTVLSLLRRGEALTHKEIARLTGLPPRTVRYALQKLREAYLIKEEWNFKDARQIRYRENTPHPADPVIGEKSHWNYRITEKRLFHGS
jgi:DNA-binding transcriptional ArsR family regulator